MTATLTLFRPSILDPVPEQPASDEIRATRLGDRLLAERRAAATATPPQARSGGASPAPAVAPAVAAPEVALPPADVDHVAAPVLGATLDDLLVGVWEDLTTHRTAACPACGGDMSPRYSAGPAPVGGRCTSCTVTIS